MFYSYNAVHGLYILMLPVLLFGFYFAFKKAPKKVQTAFLLTASLLCAGFELYDTFHRVPSGGWRTVLEDLPIWACDLNFFLLPFVILLRGEKKLLNKYTAYFIATTPIFAILMPDVENGRYAWYSNDVLGFFLPHSLYVVVAVLYLVFNNVRIEVKRPWLLFLVMAGIVTAVHLVNITLIASDAFPGANYFFTMDGFAIEALRPVANALGRQVPYLGAYFFILALYAALTFLAYGIHFLSLVIGRRLRRTDNNEQVPTNG